LLACTVPMIPIVLFITAFLVRAAVGAAFPGPAYPDSYYYVHVAQQLAAGHGLTVNYIWNLDDVPGGLLAAIPALPIPALPIPANALWMPLAELVQVPFIWLLGPTAVAAGMPFWIIGSLAAPLTYWIGRDAGLSSSTSTAAGLLAAAPAGLTPFVAQPDTFALFMTLGALSLWLCARGLRGDRRAFVLGGLAVGLAALVRSEGVLLGLPFAFVALRQLVRGRERAAAFAVAAGCAALFAIVVAPWFYRQFEVFGSISPAANSGRILWLTEYQQLFSITNPPTASGLLSQGLGPLVASRAGALIAALGLYALLPLAVVLTPFAALGAWARRLDRAFLPFFVFAGALLALNVLMFAVLVTHGTFIHSAAALVPHTYLLVAAGVGAAVSWFARRRRTWDLPRATAMFTYGAVVVAMFAAAVQTVSTVTKWSQARSTQQELAISLGAVPAGDRVMSADPGAYHYLTGHPGLVTPNDPLATVEQTMRAYDVRWLILERSSIVPSLVPVLAGEVRPAWLSQPVAVVRGAGSAVATAAGAVGAPVDPSTVSGAIYAVCLSPSDTRCVQ
jgi:hypothetical protein